MKRDYFPLNHHHFKEVKGKAEKSETCSGGSINGRGERAAIVEETSQLTSGIKFIASHFLVQHQTLGSVVLNIKSAIFFD